MAKKRVNTDILDKAIIFAVKAHNGIARKGGNLPYIIHPMEAVSIAATMTDDQELLAAAALHDVVEDTEVTLEEIRREFGDRVANLVDNESEKKTPGRESETWHERKEKAMARIEQSSRESKIVAMGDKLSNMRAIYRDYRALGDKVWDRFNTKDPAEHAWHYRELYKALSELEGTEAYLEFGRLVDEIFPS